jgi:hypothetical protein
MDLQSLTGQCEGLLKPVYAFAIRALILAGAGQYLVLIILLNVRGKVVDSLISILLPLLMRAESSGGNPKYFVGDAGRALGAYQIHEDYWQEGCEVLGVKWDYKKHAMNKKKSAVIVRAYLARWGKHYEKKTGKRVTIEVLAQIHNGGPYGWKQQAAHSYWISKIKPQLSEKGKK